MTELSLDDRITALEQAVYHTDFATTGVVAQSGSAKAATPDDATDLLSQIRDWIKNSAGVHFVTKSEQDEIDANATKDLPEVTTREQLDALAPGAAYMDGLGVRRVK
jgi:hypothetical protein